MMDVTPAMLNKVLKESESTGSIDRGIPNEVRNIMLSIKDPTELAYFAKGAIPPSLKLGDNSDLHRAFRNITGLKDVEIAAVWMACRGAPPEKMLKALFKNRPNFTVNVIHAIMYRAVTALNPGHGMMNYGSTDVREGAFKERVAAQEDAYDAGMVAGAASGRTFVNASNVRRNVPAEFAEVADDYVKGYLKAVSQNDSRIRKMA